ncbi:hypothetical protein N0V90_002724 [Kalmusia sp. IMI 367209]|nr:hypothetical protein N0V90_002724 [Kalmusia sp. IMI 367209]
MSWGQSLNRGGNRLDQYFEEFFRFCTVNNIPVVLAAGNKPVATSLHGGSPQHFGTNKNNIITVGAVKKDGTFWPGTAVPVGGKAESLTIFAPGEDIQVPTVGGRNPSDLDERSGTSQVAAMTLAPFVLHHDPEDDMNAMKRLLINHAWVRIPPEKILSEWPPNPLKVIYNLVRGDLDGHNDLCIGKRDGGNGTAGSCTTATGQNSASTTYGSLSLLVELDQLLTDSDMLLQRLQPLLAAKASPRIPTETSKYYIRTKEGTSLEDFKKFIQELDQGAGTAYTWNPDIIPHQSYLTMLRPSVANSLKEKYDFILFVHHFVASPEDIESTEEFHAVDQSESRHHFSQSYPDDDRKLEPPPQQIKTRRSRLSRSMRPDEPNAPYWKKMISSPYLKYPKFPPETLHTGRIAQVVKG